MEHNCPAVHHRHCAGIEMDAPCGKITAWWECAGGERKFGNIGVEADNITSSRFRTVDFRHIGFNLELYYASEDMDSVDDTNTFTFPLHFVRNE